jgi:hypothetical protein
MSSGFAIVLGKGRLPGRGEIAAERQDYEIPSLTKLANHV